MGGCGAKSAVRISLGGTYIIRNNTGGTITNFRDYHYSSRLYDEISSRVIDHATMYPLDTITMVIDDHYLRRGYISGLKFTFNNKEYSILNYNLDTSNIYSMEVSPADLQVKMVTLYNEIGPYQVLDIVKAPVKRTWIKNNISNLNGLHLAMGYFGGRIVNKYIPPEDTQPTNFSLKLHKFTLYEGRYKEKGNRMVYEGSPTFNARALGFYLSVNDVDSNGVQTITLYSPITFNPEKYMLRLNNITLSKSIKFK